MTRARTDEQLTFYEALCLFTLTFSTHIFSEFVPALLQEVGPSAWMTQVVSCLFGLGLLWLYQRLFRRYKGKNLLEICDAVYGRVVSKAVHVVIAVYLFLYCGFMLNQGVQILQVFAYTNMSSFIIKLVIMAGVGVFALYSIKGMAKTISIFLPAIVITILAILCISYSKYDPKLLTPVLGNGAGKNLEFSVYLTSKFNGLLILYVFSDSFTDEKSYARPARWAVLFSSALFLITNLAYAMAIPYSSYQDVNLGIVGIAQGSYNGRFLQRIESVYIAISIMSILLLLGYSFLTLKKVYCSLFGIRKQLSRSVIVPLAALVFCVARSIDSSQTLELVVRNAVRRYSVLLCVGIFLVTLMVSLIRHKGRGQGPKAKAAALILIPCLLAGSLSGCQSMGYYEPDTEIFPLIMGYDKGAKEKYRITMKFMTEAETSEGVDGESTDSEDSGSDVPSDVIVVEAPSFAEALHLMNAVMPRHVSLLHIKMLVVSEELAKDGVDGIVAPLIQYNEIKPSMAFVVCEGEAYDFIATTAPAMTSPVESDLELLLGLEKQLSAYLVTTVSDFLYSYNSTYGDGLGIYGSTNQRDFDKPEDEDDEDVSPAQKLAWSPSDFEEGYLAGQLPVIGNRQLELAGMAVFRQDRLVGKLNTQECQTLAFLKGEYESVLVVFPDPERPESDYVTLDIRRVEPVQVKTRIGQDGRAQIQINVWTGGVVALSQNTGVDYLDDPQRREHLGEYCAAIMQRRCEDLLRKLQEEYQSDVIQLGRWVAGNFLTVQEWEAYNWQEQFPRADISVSFQINQL